MRLRGFGILLLCLAAAQPACSGETPPGSTPTDGPAPGYLLFAPLLSTATYLIDKQGRVVHTWEGGLPPAISVYLLDDGRLLRTVKTPNRPPFHGAGGYGGRIQELSWDGERLWDWTPPEGTWLQHHDIEPLPGGNVLVLAWQRKSREEALEAGRRPNRAGPRGLWSDCVLEVRPVRPDGGEIVWRWCVWDHLIQDFDPQRDGYGRLAEHPERIDVNGDREPRRWTEEALRRLKALGYVSPDAEPRDFDPDFLHTNSVAYHPGLDQIVLSVPRFHEIWVIDHGTTPEQAAGGSGGSAGHGGDLLYRWGNPQVYGRGTAQDQRLFAQHDARWVPEGEPGAGRITVFNNGVRHSAQPHSTVIEIEPPLDRSGRYKIEPGEPFGPPEAAWEYTANPARSFFAGFISGAHRLPGGNTLVTDGPRGRFFEVSPGGSTVWEYQSPHSGDAPNPEGDPPYSVFRATHIPPDHPALAGRDLELVAPTADLQSPAP